VGIPNNGGAFMGQKFSARQEGDTPGNIKKFVFDIVSSFKADVATAVEMLNSNFKIGNIELVKEITSDMITELKSKFQAETQKLSDELTANFGRGQLNLKKGCQRKYR
jgi:predicted secreted protein